MLRLLRPNLVPVCQRVAATEASVGLTTEVRNNDVSRSGFTSGHGHQTLRAPELGLPLVRYMHSTTQHVLPVTDNLSGQTNEDYSKAKRAGVSLPKVLGGLVGFVAAIKWYCKGLDASFFFPDTSEAEVSLLDISTSPDRSTALVTFPMPERQFSRMFMLLNHCRTHGQDSVEIYINGKPLKQKNIDTPVFDYEEQVFRIPSELCRSGQNTVSIKLNKPHQGQYWLLDARLDAYEDNQLVLFYKSRPGGSMTGSLVV